jgi:hypothetical protein
VGEGHQHLRLLVLGVEGQLLQQEGEEGQRRILSVFISLSSRPSARPSPEAEEDVPSQ